MSGAGLDAHQEVGGSGTRGTAPVDRAGWPGGWQATPAAYHTRSWGVLVQALQLLGLLRLGYRPEEAVISGEVARSVCGMGASVVRQPV